MSVESTRTVLQDYLECLANRGPYDQYFTDDMIFMVMSTGQEVKGRAAVEQFIRAFHEQAFDAHPEVKTVMIDDGHATVEFNFVGRHIGEFGGVPASGKLVNVPYAAVYDFADDKLTAIRLYMPMDVLIQQISTPAMAEEVAV